MILASQPLERVCARGRLKRLLFIVHWSLKSLGTHKFAHGLLPHVHQPVYYPLPLTFISKYSTFYKPTISPLQRLDKENLYFPICNIGRLKKKPFIIYISERKLVQIDLLMLSFLTILFKHCLPREACEATASTAHPPAWFRRPCWAGGRHRCRSSQSLQRTLSIEWLSWSNAAHTNTTSSS